MCVKSSLFSLFTDLIHQEKKRLVFAHTFVRDLSNSNIDRDIH